MSAFFTEEDKQEARRHAVAGEENLHRYIATTVRNLRANDEEAVRATGYLTLKLMVGQPALADVLCGLLAAALVRLAKAEVS